ncbi:PR domain zinc finger protein 8 [Cyprinodon tularosa]|uniref:PR domain zinc finger protein 8 n=1 Tax=Cyprinodon tularosa TaxID=77115 RepID=UPI0018E24188|nr:PR domain zinc finger protein 8 [Cyprinodon tularosa]
MDHAFLTRSISSDAKFLQHPTDMNTGVVVTRCIPAGTCFGPCLLQNTFYETIAFIAQKCSDKTAKSFMFRVDPEAMRNSTLVLSWLRLVQAARNGEEQNAEAFLKAGQVYVRATRDIQPEEELLVWYDRELSHLLGFTDMIKGLNGEFKCGRCNQIFKNQNPFVAHCRFLCSQLKSDIWSHDADEHKYVDTKRPHQVTDFHNIARDLEQKKAEEVEIPSKKRKGENTTVARLRKTVLLEKTNISNDENVAQLSKNCHQAAGDLSSASEKLKADRVKAVRAPRGRADSAEAEEDRADIMPKKRVDTCSEAGEGSGVLSSGLSAFSLVLSGSHGEQKSAFCKPSKRSAPVEQQVHLSSAPTAPSSRLDEITDAFTNRTILGYNNMMASSILADDLQTLASPIPLGNAFHYAPELWSRNLGAQLQTTSTLTVLPPTFTSSFGVSVQNWCAKCNLSFRMTSDLVFHMRSHHKKEFAAESQVRRRREEKLTCPICHEYFRERHHLSRHMTSHN